MAGAFRICELDFDTIKLNLTAFLQGQEQFADYNFEGAGLNVLLDLLAYNTHYNAFYMNMLASESFLDSAVIRDSVVSRSKELGYTPLSVRSSSANVSIIITPPNGNLTQSIIIPSLTTFQSESVDGTNFTFSTLNAYNVSKNANSVFEIDNVLIFEGDPTLYQFVVNSTDGPQYRYVIPDANIDTNTLLVSVQQSASNTTLTTFIPATDITMVTANSNVYFLEGADNGYYALYFGDGIIGYPLSNGNIIIASYLSSDGNVANYANNFTSTNPIAGFSNVTVITNSVASGGAPAETTEHIKFMAINAYNTQNRAVTDSDYETLILEDFPFVAQASVWNGATNNPPVYGSVFVSLVPVENYFITDVDKTNIINDLITNRSVQTITPILIDPEYIYLLFKSTVYYNSRNTTLTPVDIEQNVQNAIIDYTDVNLGSFKQSFKYSRIQNIIDNSDPSIENNDLTVIMQKQFTPTPNVSSNYTLNFNTPIQPGTIYEYLTSFPSFLVEDSFGIVREAFLEENINSSTGVAKIILSNPGFGYQEAPPITITGDGVGANAYCTIINGKISNPIVDMAGSNYTIAYATIASPPNGGGQAIAIPILAGDFATLQTFYYATNGEKIIINPNAGTLQYSTGTVTLNNFNPINVSQNPQYPLGVLTVAAYAGTQTISPALNNIIILDQNNPLALSITLVDTETE